MRTNQRLFTVLAFIQKPVTRDQLLEWVYPNVPAASARNRLRVTLSNLRTELPGVLCEEEGHVSLNLDTLQCDCWAVRALLDETRNTVSTADEFDELSHVLLSRSSWEHVLEAGSVAETFRSELLAATLRGVELSESLKNPSSGVQFATLGLMLDPQVEALWKPYLEFNHQIGSGESAWMELKRIVPSATKHPELEAVYKSIRSGVSPSKSNLSKQERDLVLEAFEAVGKQSPETCLAILASPACMPLSGKFPRAMHSILATLTDASQLHDEPWQRCMARRIGLAAWLNDSDEVIRLCPAVLDTSENIIVLRATWNALAVAHALQHNWTEAKHALDQAVEFARKAEDVLGELSALGNWAHFLMHQGKYEEADALYDETLRKFSEIDTPRAKFEHAVGIGNWALVPIYANDLVTARAKLERGIEVREAQEQALQLGLLQAGLAYVKLATGDHTAVVQLARRAFLDAFGSDSARNEQITFELLAAGMWHLGEKRFATDVLNWVNDWRRDSRILRSPAEHDFAERHALSVASPSRKAITQPESTSSAVGKELMKRLRIALKSN